jgi:hypothetical protein
MFPGGNKRGDLAHCQDFLARQHLGAFCITDYHRAESSITISEFDFHNNFGVE